MNPIDKFKVFYCYDDIFIEEVQMRAQKVDPKTFSRLSWDQRLQYEKEYWQKGFQRIAGLDEAGRGPLAGPVVAAAFIITPKFNMPILNDSKQLTLKQRLNCYQELVTGQWEYGIGIIEPSEIDRINIYQASRQAMLQALQQIIPEPDFLLVDALIVPGTKLPQKPIIHGDALSVAIAAASVLAKCHRDRLMEEYDQIYPGYGFAKHKGYPTREHYLALEKLGPSPIHRQSFSLQRSTELSLELFEKDEVDF